MTTISSSSAARALQVQTAQERRETLALGVSKLSPLQSHLAFFDVNADGKLNFQETRDGLKKLGLSGMRASLAALVINAGLGPRTTGNKLLSSGGLDVSIGNVKAAKHEGDSGVFDAQGNFSKAGFDAMFAKYDTNRDGNFSATEIQAMQKDRAHTFFGKLATKGEWGLLMKLASDGTDPQGKPSISKERLQSFYDGSLFYQLAEEVAAKRAAAPAPKAEVDSFSLP